MAKDRRSRLRSEVTEEDKKKALEARLKTNGWYIQIYPSL